MLSHPSVSVFLSLFGLSVSLNLSSRPWSSLYCLCMLFIQNPNPNSTLFPPKPKHLPSSSFSTSPFISSVVSPSNHSSSPLTLLLAHQHVHPTLQLHWPSLLPFILAIFVFLLILFFWARVIFATYAVTFVVELVKI